MTQKRIAIIGAGAAGFFGAIECARMNPNVQVTIFEKSQKVLSKVKVSGGGRCNVTHSCFDVSQLVKNYPRGEKELRSVFNRFNCSDTIQWYKERGVELKTEDDGRMFPITDNSATIVNCLQNAADEFGIQVSVGSGIKELVPGPDKRVTLVFDDGNEYAFDAVLVAAGGFPNQEGFRWLRKTGHTIVKPVPSLFTLNLTDKSITSLMGVSVPDAQVKIEGTKLSQSGPVLITHWGLSGPAVLKLSSFAARELADREYKFSVLVRWLKMSEDDLREQFKEWRVQFPKRSFLRLNEIDLPKRLWEYLLFRSHIDAETQIAQATKDQMNKLVQHLLYDKYDVTGKTTFKEEFVTCGGISLREIDFRTMESKLVPNLFFAGEVLDIDAITGGFNFQAAWSTGYVAGHTIGERLVS